MSTWWNHADTIKCHSADRDNVVAHMECGMGATDPEAFKEIVDARFEYKYFPFMHG